MDNNSVLYGHNIRAGDMFHRLMDYRRAETFAKSPVVLLDGLTGSSVWIVFAAYVTEPDWGYVDPCWDMDAYADMLEEIRARSWFDTDVDVTPQDRILTLSTCDYSYEDMRFAVHARRLRPGEEIPESVTAVPNPDRKPYNIPKPVKVSEITLNRAAVLLNPRMNRIYLYHPRTGREGGIDWYSGNTTDMQGPYSNSSGPVSSNSHISAVYKNSEPRGVFYAIDHYNRQQGIQLFTAGSAAVGMTRRGLVTPAGVDAKFPALIYENEKVWLLYTVSRDRGDDIYLLRVNENGASGEPERLRTAPHGSGTRPLGYYVIGGKPLLIWHEYANKKVYAAWEDGDAFSLSLTGDADRVTLFTAPAAGRVRAAVEKNGRLTFTHLELSDLPSPAKPSPEPSPDPPPDLKAPENGDGNDGQTDDDEPSGDGGDDENQE
jgi:hypothetical protein